MIIISCKGFKLSVLDVLINHHVLLRFNTVSILSSFKLHLSRPTSRYTVSEIHMTKTMENVFKYCNVKKTLCFFCTASYCPKTNRIPSRVIVWFKTVYYPTTTPNHSLAVRDQTTAVLVFFPTSDPFSLYHALYHLLHLKFRLSNLSCNLCMPLRPQASVLTHSPR